MTDLSKLPVLHPERIKACREFDFDDTGTTLEDREIMGETAHAACEIVQKLQTGFGFAPDLYEKVEMVKRTTEQGRSVVGLIKGFLNK